MRKFRNLLKRHGRLLCLLACLHGELSACGFAGVVVSGGMVNWCERGREKGKGRKRELIGEGSARAV